MPTTQVDCYRKALRRRLGALTGQAEEDVALTVSGMAAIFKAFHAAKAAFPGRRVGGWVGGCWLTGAGWVDVRCVICFL
jgi:hypothetical protein